MWTKWCSKNDVVKKTDYNAKIKYIEDKIPVITNLAANTTLNAKVNEVKREIPSINNLATTAALNAKLNEVKALCYFQSKALIWVIVLQN